LSLLPGGPDQEIEISADDPEYIINAEVLDGNSENGPDAYSLQWEASGSGSLTQYHETNEIGSFTTVLQMPTIAGSTTQVSCRLENGSDGSRFWTPHSK
jgi:hypothetical protein